MASGFFAEARFSNDQFVLAQRKSFGFAAMADTKPVSHIKQQHLHPHKRQDRSGADCPKNNTEADAKHGNEDNYALGNA